MTGRERIRAALAGQAVDRLPVWMMRQAGRYLPGYQALRAGRTFMDLIANEDAAARITLEPVTYLDVDAAIVFHDILNPYERLGLHLAFEDGTGPTLSPPLRSRAEILALPPPTGAPGGVLVSLLARLRPELGNHKALLGFSGAPFTLAVYGVEGRMSRAREHIRRLAYADPDAVRWLADRLATIAIDHLLAQAPHVDALQIFESHADLLPPPLYEALALPALRQVITAVRTAAPHVPLILFGHRLDRIAHLVGGLDLQAVSVDCGVDLVAARGWRTDGRPLCVQGNLDPAALYAPPESAARTATAFLTASATRLGAAPDGLPHGWIVNVGDGLTPATVPASARAFVETVHNFLPRNA